MSEDDPSTHDFVMSIMDALASNRAFMLIQRKFKARSYFEFFNRILGTGFLLFTVGLVGFAVSFVVLENRISMPDVVSNLPLLLIGVVTFFWVVLVLVETINAGDPIVYKQDTPDKTREFAKMFSGLILLFGIGYEFFWKAAMPLDNLVLTLLSAILVGVWLSAIGWFFGGVSGLVRIYQSENSD